MSRLSITKEKALSRSQSAIDQSDTGIVVENAEDSALVVNCTPRSATNLTMAGEGRTSKGNIPKKKSKKDRNMGYASTITITDTAITKAGSKGETTNSNTLEPNYLREKLETDPKKRKPTNKEKHKYKEGSPKPKFEENWDWT